MSRDDEVRTQHPAFGMVQLSHVSGRRPLFQVDYPQDHYVVLRIHTAEHHRMLSNDWLHEKARIVEIAMSEVQWARFITSPNTQGIPCTLTDYRDPKSGEWLHPTLPDDHAASTKTFRNEVAARGRRAAEGVKAAVQLVDDILKGGAIRKGDVQKLKATLAKAHQELASNLGFVVEQAEEAIEKSAESAKAEVDAHIDFAMQRLGERALGERLAAAIAAGVDVKALGRGVALAVTDQREPS